MPCCNDKDRDKYPTRKGSPLPTGVKLQETCTTFRNEVDGKK